MKTATAWHKPDPRSENSVANEVRSFGDTFVAALYYDPRKIAQDAIFCAWDGARIVTEMNRGERPTIEGARAACDAWLNGRGWTLE